MKTLLLGWALLTLFAVEETANSTMPWFAQLIVAILVALPGIIAAMKIGSVHNQVEIIKDKAIISSEKQDKSATILTEIHQMTNSRLEKIDNQNEELSGLLKSALDRISFLEKELTTKNQK